MKKGFTLLELLVVISIIGMLSSVVMVSLSNAKAKARDAKLKSDFQNVALAMELYRETNNNYPGVGHWVDYSGIMSLLVPNYLSTALPLTTQSNTLYARKDYTLYGCNTGNSSKYAFYIRLEKPTAADLATMSSGDAYDVCMVTANGGMGLNYKVGN